MNYIEQIQEKEIDGGIETINVGIARMLTAQQYATWIETFDTTDGVETINLGVVAQLTGNKSAIHSFINQ